MNQFFSSVGQFHFLQPAWFLALIPLALLLLALKRYSAGSNAWRRVIDERLLPLLLQGNNNNRQGLAITGVSLVWLFAVIALADPVWQKIPRPVFQTSTARVIVLDLSRSMLIDDLKPSRLARARFKIEDILRRQPNRSEEVQTGLVVFAGDAFTAAPLTRDNQTIRSLLQVLNPEIMPLQGSRADLGLDKAHEILRQAGIQSGEVLLIADGVAGELATEAAKRLANDGYTVSVLGVGTQAGGIIPHIRDRNGQPVAEKLQIKKLQSVSSSGGGVYRTITSNSQDLAGVLSPLAAKSIETKNTSENEALVNEDWQSKGPFVVLLLLPLAALAFRRGWLMSIALLPLLSGLLLVPQTVQAKGFDTYWNNLWLRPEQQADRSLRKEQYDKASELAQDPLRRGSAEYKRGNFAQALEDFTAASGAEADYNRGNALARLGRFDEAIAAYEKALQLQPELEDAQTNKQRVEDWLKQQQQQNQQQNASSPEQSEQQEQSEQGQQKQDASAGQNEQKEEGQQSASAQTDDQPDSQEQQASNSPQNEASESSEQKGDASQQPDPAADNQAESAEETQEKDAQKSAAESDGENGEEKDKSASEQDQQQDKDENQFAKAARGLEQEKNNEPQQDKEKQAQSDYAAQDNADEKKPDSDTPEAGQNLERERAETSDSAEKPKQPGPTETASAVPADALSKEEKMAAEQWLRRIPDDPGGLLRRKFLMQYQQRNNPANGPREYPAATNPQGEPAFNPW